HDVIPEVGLIEVRTLRRPGRAIALLAAFLLVAGGVVLAHDGSAPAARTKVVTNIDHGTDGVGATLGRTLGFGASVLPQFNFAAIVCPILNFLAAAFGQFSS